jgi:hypothetical protein
MSLKPYGWASVSFHGLKSVRVHYSVPLDITTVLFDLFYPIVFDASKLFFTNSIYQAVSKP